MPRMKELIEAGLFGRGLVSIDSPVLVKRYNACLTDMGLQRTALTSFQIDRMGWSPEVAFEQGNDYYLSHGDANPLAIILTPEQATAPIYFPMHSFDWRLMDVWFRSHRLQIADLTRDTAIWLDIDQEVDLYQLPSDLSMVKEVIVRTATPIRLIERAIAQDNLVKTWLNDNEALFDEALMQKLEKTAAEDGDFRRRQLIVRNMQYGDVADFYSRAFGGVFVLRSRNHEPLVLAREEKWVDPAAGVFPANESALALLSERGYITTDIGWWQHHLYRLEVVAESFLVDVLDKKQPRVNYAKLNEAKRKRYVNEYQAELHEYTELMRVHKDLAAKKTPKITAAAASHLLHPTVGLSSASREVVWQLLTYIQGGRFVPLMYRHQKTAFLYHYTEVWKKPKSTWALARVREFYEIASKSSGLEL